MDPFIQSVNDLDNGQDGTENTKQARSSVCALQCSDLSVHLNGHHVLKNVHLCAHTGQWLAIVGPNGAGKSTLLKALAGLEKFQGVVKLKDLPLEQWVAKEKAIEMTWMGQMEPYVDDLRVLDLVQLGRMPFQKPWSTFTAEDHSAIQEAMQITCTWDLRERLMGTLSGGQAQRVLLARAFCTKSDVILMDEPLRALDPPFQSLWMSWVREMLIKGVTVVTVLHDLNVALAADRMIVLDKGEVFHEGPTSSRELHRSLERVFEKSIRVMEHLETPPSHEKQSWYVLLNTRDSKL